MKVLSIRQALLFGFDVAWRHLVYFIGALIVLLLVNIAGLFAFLGINWPTFVFFIGRLPEVCGFMFNEATPTGQELNFCLSAVLDLVSANWILYSTLFVIGFVILCLVSCYMMLGWINALLHLYDYNQGSFKALFVSPRLLVPFVISLILYMVVVFLGTLALVIPGIILAIKFGMFACVIVDKKVGAIESLRESSKITYGAKWRLFLLGLALGVIGFILGFVMVGLAKLVAGSKVLVILVEIVNRITSGFLYVVASMAGIYAYRTLNAQTYVPAKL
jgi:uncharacterized membrane protein